MEQTRICGSKLKKAQHIVELVLLAPFIILLIGTIYQISIAIHTNYKFNASLYEAISFIAFSNKNNLSTSDTVENIEKYTKILLKERHAPYNNFVKVELMETGDISIITGAYKYMSTFIPGFYNYLTIIPVNSAILRQNSFEIPESFFENDYEIEPYKEESSKEDEEESTEEPEEEAEEGTNTEEGNEENTPDTDIENTEEVEQNNIIIPEAKID